MRGRKQKQNIPTSFKNKTKDTNSTVKPTKVVRASIEIYKYTKARRNEVYRFKPGSKQQFWQPIRKKEEPEKRKTAH